MNPQVLVVNDSLKIAPLPHNAAGELRITTAATGKSKEKISALALQNYMGLVELHCTINKRHTSIVACFIIRKRTVMQN